MTEIGEYCYDGQFTPNVAAFHGMNTFSVGIFQWLESKRAYKKRSKVICRVKGFCFHGKAVYAFARKLCEDLNSGKIKPEDLQKTYTVRSKPCK